MKRIILLSLLVCTLVGCARTKKREFFEEYPAWNMPELAVTSLTVEPERADPSDQVVLHATVSAIGTGDTRSATLIFLVDDREIGRASVDPLMAGAEAELRATWLAEGPGRHLVRVELLLGENAFDVSYADNTRVAVARVSGETDPAPDLEFAEIDFASLQLNPGKSYEIPIKVRNPSYAHIGDIPISFYIDGEQVSSGVIEHLAPGQEQEFQIPWTEVTSGVHTATIRMDLPETFPDSEWKKAKTWHAVVPDATVLCDTVGKDKWVSIGPDKLTNGWAGRMNCIAFHPNPKIMYAGGHGTDGYTPAAPGLWKTMNGGANWYPVGDRLPSMQVFSVAVDQKRPNIVYVASPDGIFKSTDGGVSWDIFAGPQITGNVRELIVRANEDPYSPRVLIYAATEKGLRRYKSDFPLKKTSTVSDWPKIKRGFIRDIAVDPLDMSVVYASVDADALYRTSLGIVAKEEITPGNHDWEKLDQDPDLPTLTNDNFLHLDIFKPNSDILYASVYWPRPDVPFGIYRSLNQGYGWQVVKEYKKGELSEGLYNNYIRVHPTLQDTVYFGGVYLYKLTSVNPPAGEIVWTYLIDKVGVDMKALEFHPSPPRNSTIYYSLGDQGIFHCTWKMADKEHHRGGNTNVKFGTAGDVCEHRNNNLRVTEFYDFDVSASDPDLMIGGTQDTGTVLYEGKPTWRMLDVKNYGDGFYSLINPNSDQIMYAQFQSLESTARSGDGGMSWSDANKGLPEYPKGYMGTGYIAADLRVADGLLATPNVDTFYRTTDGGNTWTSHTMKAGIGSITRVAVNPQDKAWIFGTSKGFIWYETIDGRGSEIFDHPSDAPVTSLAVSPAVSPAFNHYLYAAFAANSPHKVYLIHIDTSSLYGVVKSKPVNIDCGQFPSDLSPRVICGDPYRYYQAYVGTDKGVWRCDLTHFLSLWQPYIDGFPLTTVVDLLIAPDKTLRAATKGRGAWKLVIDP